MDPGLRRGDEYSLNPPVIPARKSMPGPSPGCLPREIRGDVRRYLRAQSGPFDSGQSLAVLDARKGTMPTIAMPGVRAPTGGTYEECYDLGETTNVRVTVQRGEPL